MATFSAGHRWRRAGTLPRWSNPRRWQPISLRSFGDIGKRRRNPADREPTQLATTLGVDGKLTATKATSPFALVRRAPNPRKGLALDRNEAQTNEEGQKIFGDLFHDVTDLGVPSSPAPLAHRFAGPRDLTARLNPSCLASVRSTCFGQRCCGSLQSSPSSDPG